MKMVNPLKVALVACVASMGLCAGESTGVFVNGVDVGIKSSGDGWNYDSSHRINIKGAQQSYIISGEDVRDLGIRVKVECRCSVGVSNLVLKAHSGNNALWIDSSKKSIGMNLYIFGANELTGGSGAAGIGVKPEQRMTIFAYDGSSLFATGGDGGAGIGGDNGGGRDSDCGDVYISAGMGSTPGYVIAQGGIGAAGIGGGGGLTWYNNNSSGGCGGNVTVNNGILIAHGGGSDGTMSGRGGAGIGGGSYMSNNKTSVGLGGSLVVKGGQIEAYGGPYAAGIGGARYAIMGQVEIRDGAYVHAYGGDNGGAGIGSGSEAGTANKNSRFTMLGGRVFAYGGGSDAAGIGGGKASYGGTVEICDGTLEATYIGGGNDDVGLQLPHNVYMYGGSYLTTRSTYTDICGLCGRLVSPLWLHDDSWANKSKITITGIDGYGTKGIYTHDGKKLCLWLPNGDYFFTAGGVEFSLQLHDGVVTSIPKPSVKVFVHFDANGGKAMEWEYDSFTIPYEVGETLGSGFTLLNDGVLPVPERYGCNFTGWMDLSSGAIVGNDTVVNGAMSLVAQWTQGDSYPGRLRPINGDEPIRVTIRFRDLETDYDQERQYVVGEPFGDFPMFDPRGDVTFMGWFVMTNGKGAKLTPETLVPEKDTIYYGYWFNPEYHTVITYDANGGEPAIRTQGPIANTQFSGHGKVPPRYSFPADPVKDGCKFLGWFTAKQGGERIQDLDYMTKGNKTLYAHWEGGVTDWLMNRYQCAELSTLGVEVPQLSEVKAVKAENLPKGLKLVQNKDKDAWYIEGVPTAPLDMNKNFAAVRFQFKAKGAQDQLQKLALNVTEDMHVSRAIPIGELYLESAWDLIGTGVDSSWKVSGLPKDLKWNKDELVLSGKPKALGHYTATFTCKVASAVPGKSTTKFEEKYHVEYLVTPPAGDYDMDKKFDVVVGKYMDVIDLTSSFPYAADTKTKVSGLPKGVKFTAKNVSKTDYYGSVPAGSFYGKPTSTGYFAITLTHKDGGEADYLVHVYDAEAPEVGAYFGSKDTKLKKKIASGDARANQNKPIELMVGASCSFPVSASEGATVKATGLPAGLKLSKDRTTGLYCIDGYPTKEGSYLSSLTVTLNGTSSTVTYIFEVRTNAYVGEYRGYMVSYANDDSGYAATIGGVVVNVAAGGATKVTLVEKGVSTQYSFKAFGWDDMNSAARIEFETKVTKTSPIARSVTLEIVDHGGWYQVNGSVIRPAGDYTINTDGYLVAYPVVSAAELEKLGILEQAGKPRVWSLIEDVSEGDEWYYPFATFTTLLDARKGTAKVAGTFNKGQKLAVGVLPVVRFGDDADDPASYAYAPFTVYDKDWSSTLLFDLLALDGSDCGAWYDDGDDHLFGGEYISFRTAEYEPQAKGETLGSRLDDEALILFDFELMDYGSEAFHLVKNAKGVPEVYDSFGNRLATWNGKLAADGSFSGKFVSADKVYTYSCYFVCLGDGDFTGLVVRSWKEDKMVRTIGGIVDVYSLK